MVVPNSLNLRLGNNRVSMTPFEGWARKIKLMTFALMTSFSTRILFHRNLATLMPGALVLGMMGLFALGCTKPPAEKDPVVMVVLAKVTRAPISRIVAVEAVLYPLRQAAITPKITSPVKAFYVNRGTRVHSGQLLAVLENRDLAASVAENQGAYQQAQAAYSTQTAATLPEEMQKAVEDVRLARETLAAQQKLYDSRKALFAEGAFPRKDLDQAAVALVQAKGQYELASRHLKSLQSVVKTQEIKSAAGQLSAARGKYQGATAQLAYSEVRSPIDGVVTDRPNFAGEVPAPGSPVITVMDISKVIARAHIPQPQAALLRVGNAARLEVPGLESPINGTLTLISPALDPGSTTVEVWVEATNPQQVLKPGTTVHLNIVVQTVHAALVIPHSAILTGDDGKSTVMVVGPNEKAQSREISLGIQQSDLVEITNGLREGEQVISSGSFGLADNIQVKVQGQGPKSSAGKSKTPTEPGGKE